MLSDEEKKAIEYWKTHMEILHWNTQLASEHYIKVLLDLIEKQSKEIEELSDKLTEKICKGVEEEILEEYRQTIISKDKEIEELKEKFSETYEYFKRDFTPNDKIKAKIEEVKDGTYDAKIVLQSLLEKE